MGYLELGWGSPLWVLPLSAAAGLAWAWAKHGRPLPNQPSRKARLFLGILRGLAVFLLVLLCFDPTWIREERIVQSPLIVLALDQSQSMNRPGVSAEALRSFALEFTQKLRGTHRIDVVGFGAGADRLNPSQPGSVHLDQSLTSTEPLAHWTSDQAGLESIAAWVLVSDGLFNMGMEPRSFFANYQSPVLTLGCGPDQGQLPTWTLGSPSVPDRVEAHSDLEIEIPVRGHHMTGQTLQVEALVSAGSSPPILAERRVWQPGAGSFQQNLTFKISIGEEGLYAIRFRGRSISGASGPGKVLDSPEKLAFVEAVRTKKRLLLLAKAPHPDLGVLRSVLEQTKNHVVQLEYGLAGLRKAVADPSADLYIWHQWPSANPEPGEADLLQKIQQKGQPLWWMGGAASDWKGWPEGRPTASVPMVQVLPVLNDRWNAFLPGVQLAEGIRRLPPLTTPSLGPIESPVGTTLLYQQKDRVVTQRPLWVVEYRSRPTRAYLWGEGLWRWRLAMDSDHRSGINGSVATTPLESLVLNTVSLLLGGQASEGLEIRPVRPFFNETQPVLLEGSLRNAQGEFDNQSTLRLQLFQKDRLVRDAAMVPDGLGYRLDLGRLEAGTYRYTATTSANGLPLVKNGVLAVQSFGLENPGEPGDHALLQNLAKQSGGTYLRMDAWDAKSRAVALNQLSQKIKKHPTIRSESSLNLVSTPWLRSIWFWVLVSLLLGAEWLLARALGGI